MLYACIQSKQIRLLHIKKSRLGAIDTTWSTHTSPRKLLTDHSFAKLDIVASTLTEALTAPALKHSETQTIVVLDADLYTFARIEIPADIPKPGHDTFVREKLTSVHKLDLMGATVDFTATLFGGETTAFVYVISREVKETLTQLITSVGLQLVAIVPEQLAYYTLFEKTVRFDKREQILYAIYNEPQVMGFSFDTFGPIPKPAPWTISDVAPLELEAKLREKTDAAASEGTKLNRVIMSGTSSDTIRQDTFTKNIGVWTNPLKRIIPNFYQEYMTQIHGKTATDILPILSYDALLGAYIAHAEAKSFGVAAAPRSKKTVAYTQTITSTPPSAPMISSSSGRSIPFLKEIMLFLAIFGVVFSALYFLLQGKTDAGVTLPSLFAQATPTVAPTIAPTEVPPTPTPTIEVKRAEVKLRILNGTGIRGQAAGINKLLSGKGYTSITLGNAASFGLETSEVNIKKSKASLKDTVSADIKDTLAAPKFGELADTDAVDVEIILGKDAN